jgi:hypothetical protein
VRVSTPWCAFWREAAPRRKETKGDERCSVVGRRGGGKDEEEWDKDGGVVREKRRCEEVKGRCWLMGWRISLLVYCGGQSHPWWVGGSFGSFESVPGVRPARARWMGTKAGVG